MEDWNVEEPKKKENSKLINKILIVMMALLVIIIIVIAILLYIIKANTIIMKIDDKNTSFSEKFIKEEGNTKYINIKEMASLLGVQYHLGEYKVFSSEQDKCYIQSAQETASFYLNSDKVCKLKLNDFESDYDVFNCSANIIEIDNEYYAPTDAIKVAFNISFEFKDNEIDVITLSNLVNIVEANINKNKTYNSLLNEDFDNQKALLYNYVIASKADSNLYSVLSLDGKTEIISDRYKNIEFIEPSKEFLVTNSLDKVGIIDSNGQNKIDQLYDSIKIINNDPKLYMVEVDKKYGVIDEDGNTIIYNEYDKIGLETTYTDIQNQYVLLNSVIPVQKDNKYGLFNINANKILDVKYDGIGCNVSSMEVEGSTKSVTPAVVIQDCYGIVIKTGENYDLYLVDNNELVSLKVTSIYSIKESGNISYYMIYKGQEMNLIENLKKLGYIKEDSTQESANEETNTVEVGNNTITYEINEYNTTQEQGISINKVENLNQSNQ